MQKIIWELFSNTNRHEAIDAIKNIISDNDGCIMNFTSFSDLALGLSIEIEENKIQVLHKELSVLGNLSNLESDLINLESKKEWLIFMNISFGQGKGDLKNEIPDVPG